VDQAGLKLTELHLPLLESKSIPLYHPIFSQVPSALLLFLQVPSCPLTICPSSLPLHPPVSFFLPPPPPPTPCLQAPGETLIPPGAFRGRKFPVSRTLVRAADSVSVISKAEVVGRGREEDREDG